MLLRNRYVAKKLTPQQIQQNELLKRTDDLVAQLMLLKRREAEIKSLHGLDFVKWKKELEHYSQIKQDIDHGIKNYATV
jgi:hypothetical protein